MKNRNIILTAILSLLGCGGLSYTALAAAPTGNVNVVNTTTNPVPTIAADNPALNAVNQDVTVLAPAGQPGGTVTIGPTPAGKTFVLEFVSYVLAGSAGADLIDINIGVSANNPISAGRSTVQYYLTIPPPAVPHIFSGSQAMRVYVPQQTSIVITFDINALSNGAVLRLALSGYFVNAQ